MAKRAVLNGPHVPAAIKTIWGEPSILTGENGKAYDLLVENLVKAIEPKDIIDWLLVKNLADLAWDIRRLQRFKLGLLAVKEEEMSSSGESPGYSLQDDGDASRDEVDGAVGNDSQSRLTADEYCNTQVFLWGIKDWELIDQFLAVAQARFIATSRELERRRHGITVLLREAVNDKSSVTAENTNPTAASGDAFSDQIGNNSTPHPSRRSPKEHPRTHINKTDETNQKRLRSR